MDYIHIKALEKYHPGYKDRKLIWAKIFFTTVQGDPDCEMIVNEIDWARLVKFILLELQAQKPIPLDNFYLTKKGFDLKKRPISTTIKELHNFLEVVTNPLQSCNVDIDKDIELDKEEELDKEWAGVTEFLAYFNLKTNKNLSLTKDREKIIKHRLSEYTIDCLKTAVDNFIADDWQDRHKFCDIIYCIGIRNKIDNLEKWLNYTPKKTYTKAQVQTIKNREEWKNDRENAG